MHCGLISDVSSFYCDNPGFKTAFAYLQNLDCTKSNRQPLMLENGVKVIFSEYETKDYSELRYETHDRYFDIQCLLSGKEYVCVFSRDHLNAATPYDEAKDITFYDDPETDFERILLEPGKCVLLGCLDAHKPNCKTITTCHVRKVVLKVPILK